MDHGVLELDEEVEVFDGCAHDSEKRLARKRNAERLSEVDAAVLDEAINEFASESAH